MKDDDDIDESDMIELTEAVNRIMEVKGCGRRKAEKILLKLLRSGEVRSYFEPYPPKDAH
jgi:hypothetical protein